MSYLREFAKTLSFPVCVKELFIHVKVFFLTIILVVLSLLEDARHQKNQHCYQDQDYQSAKCTNNYSQ